VGRGLLVVGWMKESRKEGMGDGPTDGQIIEEIK